MPNAYFASYKRLSGRLCRVHFWAVVFFALCAPSLAWCQSPQAPSKFTPEVVAPSKQMPLASGQVVTKACVNCLPAQNGRWRKEKTVTKTKRFLFF